jgi:TM2 domain-containing membrane protein YozV
VLAHAPKSRGVFIILGLFLGCLGVHNFYAGYYAKGAIQVAITVVLGWVIVGFVITALWALIEIITVTADADGQRMS